MLRRGGVLALLVTTVSLGPMACGGGDALRAASASHPPASGASSAVDPPDVRVPILRTGSLAPADAPGVIDGKLLARHVGEGIETLVVEIPRGSREVSRTEGTTVAVEGSTLFSFETLEYSGTSADRVWVRRSATAAGSPLRGELRVPAPQVSYPSRADATGRLVHFRVTDTTSKPSETKTLESFLRAFAQRVSAGSWRAHGAWQAYASERLNLLAQAMAPKPPPKKPAKAGKPVSHRATPVLRPTPPPPRDDLARLMETTTGATAVQEALQQDRGLFIGSAKEQKSVPLASLTAPALGRHPWKEMTAKLGGAVPEEPLATHVPAEFYYARAKDLPTLFRLLDAVDDWGTPAARIAASESEDRALAKRYEAQLGLERTEMARAIGGSVVGEVGIIGSDPYVKEGSDVTLLFRVKSRALFDAALATTLAGFEHDHGTLDRSSRTHGGVTVSVATSADGAVRQQRASLGELEIVSNSPGAVDAVLEAAAGNRPKLSDEADFRFMLARDAGVRSDALVYMSDRFVAQVVGPKQKVLEARREIALGELMTPGFAALLDGWLYGKSPATVDELVSHGLLDKDDLTHASGGAITWSPGTAARSRFGTPAALTPLIDLPAPDPVTDMERVGYERFARTYEQDWAGYIDPVALRIAIDDAGGRSKLALDLRQLPLIDGTDYRRFGELVGDSRFMAGATSSGLRGVAALGEESWPRALLGQTLRSMSGHEIKLEWIGDWAAVGVADRAEVAKATLAVLGNEVPQRPMTDKERPDHDNDVLSQVARLPIYAEVGIGNMAGAALGLVGLRVMAEEAIPGLFEWGESEQYRGVSVVRVRNRTDSIYYAICKDALVVTLTPWVIRHRIDDRLDGRGPESGKDKPEAATTQMMIDLSTDKGGGLWSALTWLTEGQLLGSDHGEASGVAEALLRGAPEIAQDAAKERELAFAYFGAAPLTTDGGAFTLATEGLVDPVRGSAYAPVWPALPVPGSPLEKLTSRLAGVHTELAFDDEGMDGKTKMRSLHAKVVVEER